jgi:PAS domain S-box-containing protein
LNGERVTFASTIRHKDGAIHDIEVTYAPHFSEPNVVCGLIVSIRDTTAERRAQDLVKEREKDLLSVLNNVPDVISRYNRDLRFVFTSAAVERHTGFPPEHFTGKSHAELGFPPELCSLLEDGLREIFATRSAKTLNFEFPGPHGLRQFEAFGSPELGDDGTVESVLTVTHDITSRLQAEQELRRSEARQRLAVEAGKVGLWHWDIRTNRVEWSDLIYELHGLQKEDFGGALEDFVTLIHPDDRELVSQALSSALAGLTDYHVEFRTVRPDGAVRWMFANGKVVFQYEQPIAMLGAIIDVTESKAAAEALTRANEELRRANEDLNQFAYSASHDLKEPLRMIALYTQLLKRKYVSSLEGDAPRYIGYVIDGARRMDNLLHDLLVYTEAVTSGTEAMRQPVDMNHVLEIVRTNLMVLIEETGAIISSEPLPVLPWRETHAIQVLQNLIANAIKYRDPHRPLRIQIRSERHARTWQLSISDNGIGVEARYYERIFGMFKRLHTSDKYEGTGIGLALCQKMIERNGGRIWIESEPGRGSTFYFTCPAA